MRDADQRAAAFQSHVVTTKCVDILLFYFCPFFVNISLAHSSKPDSAHEHVQQVLSGILHDIVIQNKHLHNSQCTLL